MNQLNKDQKQKIFLSTLLMIGLVYCYFNFLLDPLAKADRLHAAEIESLDGSLGKAKTALKRSKNVQAQAQAADETLAQVGDMIPEGAPIAWFPPRLRAFFDRHGLKGAGVRPAMLDAAPDPTMLNFRNSEWTIELPQANIGALGNAIAGLENEEKLMEVSKLQISSPADNPEKQHVTMSVLMLLR